jgi:hypothetical protein
MANFTDVVEQLRQKRKEVQRQVHKLDRAISVLKGLASISADGTRAATMRPGRRMSAAARRRIAQAQKARWAKWRKQSKPTTSPRMVAPKRTMSLAARRRIAAAQRARWAKFRQQAKKAA